MSITIPKFFFEASPQVKELSDEFLTRHKLSYFQYCTVYDDGTHSFLVTRPDFVEERFKSQRGVRSSAVGEQLDAQNFIFLWNGNLPDPDTDMARDFDIDNGICFVQRYPKYYHLIAFGSPRTEKGMLNFYLNNMTKLRSFIDDFSYRGRNLIQEAESKRFQLTEDLRDSNEKVLLWNRKLTLHTNKDSIEVSIREYESLRLTAHGYTMSDVAKVMQISPRTVETYLERLKHKLGVSKKSELVRVFNREYIN